MDGDDEFYEGLDELAERSRALVDGGEDAVREERGRDADIQLLRELVYSLESVSMGTHQLLYFSAMKYAGNCLDCEADSREEAVDELAAIFDAMNLGTLELADDGEPAVVELAENAFTYNAPESGRTMCYFLAGYIAGFMENCLDGNVVVNEASCSAEGNEVCTFEIQER
ncbi:MAG: V4R domain-containing protein [Candidatus Nanohaloarchaea archaeon]|nr:V4R domain-containing protein [Candidatus Nanohaloarchaea archaeon]